MRAVESEAPGLSSQSDGDTTSSSESPRRASCFEIFEINKGYCDRIFGSKILEGLRAPAPAVMPGMLRLSTEALAESPRRGIRVPDCFWTRPGPYGLEHLDGVCRAGSARGWRPSRRGARGGLKFTR